MSVSRLSIIGLLTFAAAAFAQSPVTLEIGRVNPDEGKTKSVQFETGGKLRTISVDDPAPIGAAQIQGAKVATRKINVTSGANPETKDVPVIQLEFTEEGKKLLADLTTRWEGKLLAVLVDGKVIATPKIGKPIVRGDFRLSGAFTAEEAKALVDRINSARGGR